MLATARLAARSVVMVTSPPGRSGSNPPSLLAEPAQARLDRSRHAPGSKARAGFEATLEAAELGLDLGAAQTLDRVLGHRGVAEQGHLLAAAPHLAHPQHGFPRDVLVVGDDRGNHVDAAGAALERLRILA